MKIPDVYPHLVSALDRYHRRSESTWTEPARARRSRPTGGLRILLGTFWKHPTNGGLSNYLTSLKSGLEGRGHRVTIVHPDRFDSKEMHEARVRAKSAAERFLHERYGQANPQIVTNLQHMLSYEALLSEKDLKKYDTFHAQDRFTANILGRLNRSYGKPLLFTPHGPMTQNRVQLNLISQGSEEEAYYGQIDRRAVEAADKVVMLSETFRPLLTSLGAENSKLETIYTGIDLKLSSKNPKDDCLVISCVSRLGPRKGHSVLLEALHLVRDQLPDVRVNIVGDGETRSELERQASRLGLRNVAFLGHRDDVASILARSHIYVLPTTNDTLPISVIEAMVAGKAIVTTRCGGIPEIVRHQETGLLAEPGNVTQLADCLLQLARDRHLIEQLGRNAREFARTHLTVDKMAAEVERVYRSVHAS